MWSLVLGAKRARVAVRPAAASARWLVLAVVDRRDMVVCRCRGDVRCPAFRWQYGDGQPRAPDVNAVLGLRDNLAVKSQRTAREMSSPSKSES